MRRVPLSVQLLLAFVGLLTAITIVLARSAYTSLLDNLDTTARQMVSAATRTREQSLTQLFQLRQQRAEAFLVSVQSICAEPLESGRTAWADGCVRPMVDDFRKGERALAALLMSERRTLRRSGLRVAPAVPPPGALARVVRDSDGAIHYAMQAARAGLTLTLHFDHDQVARLFAETGLGPGGELSLVDYDGHVLARAGTGPESLSAESAAAFVKNCRTRTDAFVDIDS